MYRSAIINELGCVSFGVMNYMETNKLSVF